MAENNRITVSEAIVVEGKYDKIKLSSIFNAVIIVLDGFGIYKDKEKLSLLRYYADTVGLVVLTDSDSAGFRIRGYLKGAVKGNVKHVYIPDVFGKEKRKEKPSAEGKLGVEGMQRNVILKAFENAGICLDAKRKSGGITKLTLFELGLSGTQNSALMRKCLLDSLGLPSLLTTNSMLDVLNTMMTEKELADKVAALSVNF
ncbi:MAG: DUF4093 domain-containing protein [Oscillospiraceae bacterium]|nr:DUF4093 domain-containing protein [Oscillospiraceae bacterium]